MGLVGLKAWCVEGNTCFVFGSLDADERFLWRAADAAVSTEPHVMRYIAEALLEDEDSELDPDETGLVFLTLKTVVDLLHEARVEAASK